jgi:hypothetical protein
MIYLSFPPLVPHLQPRLNPRPRIPELQDEDEEDEESEEELSDYGVYIPRIFGFRVSELSEAGPRMGWLRWKEGMGMGSGNGGFTGALGAGSRVDDGRGGLFGDEE